MRITFCTALNKLPNETPSIVKFSLIGFIQFVSHFNICEILLNNLPFCNFSLELKINLQIADIFSLWHNMIPV